MSHSHNKSFILFQEYKENLQFLSQSQKGDLLDAIFAFNEGVEIELEPVVKMAFSFIKSDLQRNSEKWEVTKEERSASGRIGNLKRWNPDLFKQYKAESITLEEAEGIAKHRKTSLCDKSDSLKSQSIANVAVNVNEDVNVNVNVNEDVNDKKKVTVANFSDFHMKVAITIKDLVETKFRISIKEASLKKWSSSIRKLHEIDLKSRSDAKTDIVLALKHLSDFFGEKYIPEVRSGESFREKFLLLENSIKRKSEKFSSNSYGKLSKAEIDQANDELRERASSITDEEWENDVEEWMIK